MDLKYLHFWTVSYQSFVFDMKDPRRGSWFIQTTMEVFERHYKKRHAEEMMTVVGLCVAEERGLLAKEENELEIVRQMPCKISTLRYTFFL